MKILASSDFHVGMKFQAYPELKERLAEARITAVKRVVQAANTHDCQLLIIAGDLFDGPGVPKAMVHQVRKYLEDFTGALVAVMPGNHDYITTESELWRAFTGDGKGKVLVLSEPKAYDLAEWNLVGTLFAAPCGSKHSAENGLGWMKRAGADLPSPRIAVAHGSIEGISPDMNDAYFPMKRQEIAELGMDAVIIGHTHVPKNLGRLFIPGTPEPDGFDCQHKGNAFVIDVTTGAEPVAQSVETGAFHFSHRNVEILSKEDLKKMEAAFEDEACKREMTKIRLRGRVPREVLAEVGRAIEGIRPKVAGLVSVENSELKEKVGVSEIEAKYRTGSFAHDLLTELAKEGADEGALQEAWELFEESAS